MSCAFVAPRCHLPPSTSSQNQTIRRAPRQVQKNGHPISCSVHIGTSVDSATERAASVEKALGASLQARTLLEIKRVVSKLIRRPQLVDGVHSPCSSPWEADRSPGCRLRRRHGSLRSRRHQANYIPESCWSSFTRVSVTEDQHSLRRRPRPG